MELTKAVRRAIEKNAAEAQARKTRFAWALGLDTLYKFKGFAGAQRVHVEDMLRDSRVYFASPDQFNDPYDVAPVLRLAGDPNDLAFLAELEATELQLLEARGLSSQHIDELRQTRGFPAEQLASEAGEEIRRTLRSSLRIFCLSAEQCHPLQWSHYADQHRGLCLHFRSAAGTSIGLARQVVYQQDRTPIFLPTNRQSDDDIVDRMSLVKADFWKYEREFRIIASPGVDAGVTLNDNFASFAPDLLIGITVGMRMSDEDRHNLLSLVDAHRPQLPVWEAVEDLNRFWMQTRRLR